MNFKEIACEGTEHIELVSTAMSLRIPEQRENNTRRLGESYWGVRL